MLSLLPFLHLFIKWIFIYLWSFLPIHFRFNIHLQHQGLQLSGYFSLWTQNSLSQRALYWVMNGMPVAVKFVVASTCYTIFILLFLHRVFISVALICFIGFDHSVQMLRATRKGLVEFMSWSLGTCGILSPMFHLWQVVLSTIGNTFRIVVHSRFLHFVPIFGMAGRMGIWTIFGLRTSCLWQWNGDCIFILQVAIGVWFILLPTEFVYWACIWVGRWCITVSKWIQLVLLR